MHQLFRNGLDNYICRWVSSGRWFDLQILKSFKESVFCQELFRCIRTESNSFDIDAAAAAEAVNSGQPFGSKEEKRNAYKALAEKVFDSMNNNSKSKSTVDALLQQVKTLTEQLTAAKAGTAPQQDNVPAPKRGAKPQTSLKEMFKTVDIASMQNKTDKKPLEGDKGPATARKSTVDEWCNKNMPADEKTKDAITTLVTKLSKQYERLSAAKKVDLLETVANSFGLPFKVAGNCNKDSLIKTICIASYLTE